MREEDILDVWTVRRPQARVEDAEAAVARPRALQAVNLVPG